MKGKARLLRECNVAIDFLEAHPLGHKGEFLEFKAPLHLIRVRQIISGGVKEFECVTEGRGNEKPEITIRFNIHRICIDWKVKRKVEEESL